MVTKTYFLKYMQWCHTRCGHSPSKIVIQPVEKIIYDPNSSIRLKNIKRHETDLNGLNFAITFSFRL